MVNLEASPNITKAFFLFCIALSVIDTGKDKICEH
jgi:hypothetical protein